MEDQDIKHALINEEELDLVEIVKKLWRNRKFIFKVTTLFAVLGFLVAISSPSVYTASCTMVPQTGQKNTGGSLGGLAAMAGINLGSLSSGEVLSPSVYPKIMTNINFQKELIYSKFHFQGVEQPISLYDYYTDKKYQKFSLIGTLKKYTIGLPGIIFSAGKDKPDTIIQYDNSAVQSLTSEEKGVIKIISTNSFLVVNSKDGYISLIANMPEPLLSAELVQKEQELLQKYITEFKNEKVACNLKFVEQNYDEAKLNFELKQVELARFRDANKSFTSAVAKTQEEKLTSEYDLLLGVYSELAKQKEQAKIAVTETTPILTVIEPVVIPIERSKPKRSLILISFTFIGLIVGLGMVFIIQYLESNYILNNKNYWFVPKIL